MPIYKKLFQTALNVVTYVHRQIKYVAKSVELESDLRGLALSLTINKRNYSVRSESLLKDGKSAVDFRVDTNLNKIYCEIHPEVIGDFNSLEKILDFCKDKKIIVEEFK